MSLSLFFFLPLVCISISISFSLSPCFSISLFLFSFCLFVFISSSFSHFLFLLFSLSLSFLISLSLPSLLRDRRSWKSRIVSLKKGGLNYLPRNAVVEGGGFWSHWKPDQRGIHVFLFSHREPIVQRSDS